LAEAISNISEIVDKIEIFDFGEVLLPKFENPVEFNNPRQQLMGVRGENAYLRHLTLRVLKALSSNY
jgi:DNA polymerase-3 subunit alpha